MPYQNHENLNLSGQITRYIYTLIAIITSFALIIIGFLLLQFKSYSDIEHQIKNYHQPSIEYINNINTEYQLFFSKIVSNKTNNKNETINHALPNINKSTLFTNFLNVTERSLNLLYELHDKHAVKQFNSSVTRLKKASLNFLERINYSHKQKLLSQENIKELFGPLKISLTQIKRLHLQNQQHLYTNLSQMKKNDQLIQFATFLILFSIGSLITYRVIRLIRTVLQKQKESTHALVEFKTTLDSTGDCVFIFHPDSLKFKYVNKGAIQQVKYSYDEMMKMSPVDIKPEFTEEKFRDLLKQIIRTDTPVTFETIHQDKQGNQIPVEINLECVHLPDNQSHFLALVRDITSRKQTYKTINFLAQARPTPDLGPFLKECIRNLTQVYKSKYAFIGLIVEPQRSHVRTLAVRSGNQYAQNFEYALLGTPCADIISYEKSIIETRASMLYADDQMLIDMDVDSYFGAPLITSTGKIIGLVSVLDTKPMKLTKENESILEVFATRIASELERKMALDDLDIHQKELEQTIEHRTSDLVKAKSEAEKASKSKSIFLSNMSHELRTPMNAILGFAQLIELDAHDDKLKRNVDEILRAGNHLLELINEVLDLTKIESGHINLSIDNASLQELIEDCMFTIIPMVNESGLKYINNIPEDKDYLINIDYTRAKQVLLNLLSNAIKYNQDNGYISMNSEIKPDGYIRLAISDSGKGLNQEQQDKLFQPFERAGAENSNIEGTGIGLVICKQLIELMGGNIGLDSTPGIGSTFWVDFKLIQELQRKIIPVDKTPEQSITEEKDSQKKPEKTVLYIEDNPANLRLVENLLLPKSNITLVAAHEPVLGLNLANNTIPDLIFLDINLPGMNGFEVLKIIKQSSNLNHIPVVALSANAMAGDIRHGIEAGFDDYLAKPINISEFYVVVDKYCN